MATVEVKDLSGAASGNVDVSDSIFCIKPNIAVMHQVVRAQRASWRQGTSNTLTRGYVRGGGRKPWRQKGTGRARQGTIRAPQWRGGGVVFGPHPRSYAFSVNKKEIKLAMRSAFSAKLADEELIVVDAFKFDQPKTKEAVKVLEALGLGDKRVTIMIGQDELNAFLSFRNISKVNVIPVNEMNTYEIIDNKAVVLTSAALTYIEEALG